MKSTKQGRHSSMAALERRQAVLSFLTQRRKVTYREMEDEFGVTKRTLIGDIAELSCHHPIDVTPGNGGGISLAEGYYPDGIRMTREMTALLRKCMQSLSGHEAEVMETILIQFGAR